MVALVGAIALMLATTVEVSPERDLADAVRALRRQDAGEKVIVLRPGTYRLCETLELDDRDSGLVIRAQEKGKSVLSGAVPVGRWSVDSDGYWFADVPKTNGCPIDVRALLVDGRLAPRACYPGGEGRLENLGDWNQPLREDLQKPWDRPPTRAELTEMPYRPEDIPAGMDLLNADIRLYHMWAESLCPVVSNDLSRHVIVLGRPASWPMGACGRRQYEICNVREGLTQEGQWYHDRRKGKVVYRPRRGENPRTVRAEVPVLDRLVSVAGCGARGHASRIRLEGIVAAAAATSSESASFGGAGLPCAIRFFFCSDCALVDCEVRDVGAVGVFVDGSCVRPLLRGCSVHHTGSTGVQFAGIDGLMEATEVSHVGLMYPSAAVVGFGGTRTVLRGCEIHHGPYCGVCGGGSGLTVESNYIHHVMLQLQDGGGVYLGQVRDSVMRGNLVSDVVPNGSGFGVSAFYYDQNSVNCRVENNVTLGVERPVHNNVTRQITVRDNAFFAPGGMTVSFQGSTNGCFRGNLLCFNGNLDVVTREGIDVWTNNVVRSDFDFAKVRPAAAWLGKGAFKDLIEKCKVRFSKNNNERSAL